MSWEKVYTKSQEEYYFKEIIALIIKICRTIRKDPLVYSRNLYKHRHDSCNLSSLTMKEQGVLVCYTTGFTPKLFEIDPLEENTNFDLLKKFIKMERVDYAVFENFYNSITIDKYKLIS